MRVLVVTDTLAPSYGWGRYAIGLIRALRDEGADLRILSPLSRCTEPDLASMPGHGSVTSYVSETRRMSRLVLANTLAIWRASRDCDVVHCVTEPYSAPAAVAGLVGLRRPLVVTVHGTYAVRPFRRPGARPWYELGYGRANRLVAVSRYTRDRLPTRFASRTVIVPEGVEHERFATASHATSTALSGLDPQHHSTTPHDENTLRLARPIAPPDENTLRHPGRDGNGEMPYLLSVGPVKRRNGYQTTIEAFAELRKVRPDLEYWIVGGTDDPVFLTSLRATIARLGLGDAVKFLGRVDEATLVGLYHGCMFFWLLPEDDGEQFHGFGLVYWEANACGRPVIGASDSGAGDAIEDGTNGLLIRSARVDEAVSAARRLIDSPELRERLGKAGITHAKPWRDAAVQMMGVYRDVRADRA
ncbi:MAG: glycosyltransferase family 1 protein, partial [Proteobacteria bacterium]|nr:glycosyltransferase family 1 protein [Pseudomonadota bacterium]